jgi:hypothetical protein
MIWLEEIKPMLLIDWLIDWPMGRCWCPVASQTFPTLFVLSSFSCGNLNVSPQTHPSAIFLPTKFTVRHEYSCNTVHLTLSTNQSINQSINHQVPKCIGLLYDNTLCVGDCIHWQLTIDIDNDDQFILQLTI